MKKYSLKELVKKRKKKGFTLIELIIVIAVIAILAAMAIPKFGAVRKSANIKTDIASAKNIQTAAATLLAEGKDKDEAAKMTNIAAKLDGGEPTPKAMNGKFSVDIDNNDNITVKVGSVEVYPTPDGIYQS